MKVISYCLFGRSTVYARATYYWQCLAGVVRAHHNLFPGWELWLHHDDGDVEPLRGYEREGLVKMIPCGPVPKASFTARLWRMKPLWEPGVEYLLSRDIDSVPLPKDRKMVEAFIASGLAAHSQADHPAHTAHFMAGMCGFHAPQCLSLLQLKSWAAFIVAGKTDLSAPTGGPDQQHMYEVLWPKLEAHCLHHRLRNGIPGTVRPLTNLHQSVPDIVPSGVTPFVLAHGDSLAAFMGDAGFDVASAIEFYDAHGWQEITRRVRKAEAC